MTPTQTQRSPQVGFSLLELLIVCSIMVVLSVPLINFTLLPQRTMANLVDLFRVSRDYSRFVDHLAADLRYAESFSINTESSPENNASLSIQLSDDRIEYTQVAPDRIVREQKGKMPITHEFKGIHAAFRADTKGVYPSLTTHITLTYPLLKGPLIKERTVVLCSLQETQS